jgi:hypothetical protein
VTSESVPVSATGERSKPTSRDVNARRQNHHKLRDQNNRHTFQETA